MADKNKNGIPDNKELDPSNSLFAPNRPKGAVYKQTQYSPAAEGIPGLFNQLNNWRLDTNRNIGNFLGSIGEWATGSPRTPGGGVGDSMWGSAASGPTKFSGTSGGSFGPAPDPTPVMPQQFDMPQSFMAYLTDALENSPVARVSFDPQREDARRRGSEYDARLAAMYNQLQGSMRNDNTALQGSYQGAIDDAAARNAAVQQQIQASSNVADDRNAQVLKNLGIEQAQGNIVNEGRDLNTQTAKSVADAAARGQITGDALGRNQQSAAQAGNSLVGAAGLEGNLQRARVQDQLSQLLAQYDMQEQEANRQAQQQSFAQAMGLANANYEDAWKRLGYQDDKTKYLMQQSAQRTDPMQYSMNFVGKLMDNPAFQDYDPDQLIKLLSALGGVGKLAN